MMVRFLVIFAICLTFWGVESFLFEKVDEIIHKVPGGVERIVGKVAGAREGRDKEEFPKTCPSNSQFSQEPFKRCEYTCTPDGVDLRCGIEVKSGSCRCNFDTYYNTESGECSEVKCNNMDCVGRRNEGYVNCESGSRDSCTCSSLVTLDCNTGCMCKNGYCRQNGICQPRTCRGSPFDA